MEPSEIKKPLSDLTADELRELISNHRRHRRTPPQKKVKAAPKKKEKKEFDLSSLSVEELKKILENIGG